MLDVGFKAAEHKSCDFKDKGGGCCQHAAQEMLFTSIDSLPALYWNVKLVTSRLGAHLS